MGAGQGFGCEGREIMKEMGHGEALSGVSVAEALEAILDNFGALARVRVPLGVALGLVLAEARESDSDIPPFDNSSMDGYAVRAEDTMEAGEDAPSKL